MKTVITARLYALIFQGTQHELIATTASDLATQVQALTGSRQAAGLARAAWSAERADLTGAGVRLVAIGQMVRQIWVTLPQGRSVGTSSADAQPDTLGSEVAPEVGPAHPGQGEPYRRPLRRPPVRAVLEVKERDPALNSQRNGPQPE